MGWLLTREDVERRLARTFPRPQTSTLVEVFDSFRTGMLLVPYSRIDRERG
jgi:hypothetical protein